MKKSFILVVMIFLIMLFAGCMGKSQLCAVPEAEGSKICAFSEKLHLDPAYMSQGLLAINFVALKKSVYTPGQAYVFVEKLENELTELRAQGKVWTIEQAINYIDGKLNVLPEDVRLAFQTFDIHQFTDIEIKLPITDYDFELILRHLAKQKALIEIFG